MAKFFKKPSGNLRTPFYCFSAMAVGCLMGGSLSADENDKDKYQSKSAAPVIQTSPAQFSPMPSVRSAIPAVQVPMPPSGLTPSSESAVTSGFVPPANAALAPVFTKPAVPAVNPASGIELNSFGVADENPRPQSANARDGQFRRMPLTQNVGSENVRVFPKYVAPKVRNGVHQLVTVSIEEFETAVVRTWGRRLGTATSPDGRYVRVEIPTRVAQRMAMIVDRQRGSLKFEGDDSLRDNWHQLMESIDCAPELTEQGSVRQTVLVDASLAELKTVQQAAFLMGLTQDITQPDNGSQEDITEPEASVTLPPGTTLPQNMNQDVDETVKDEVKIIQDPVTGIITIVGSKADVEVVTKMIAEISAKSKSRQALVERIPLEYLLSAEVAEQIQEIYDASYAPSTGAAKIQALSSPNAIVVVGQPAGIKAVQDLVGSMDVVATNSELGGFEAIPLKYLSAADAKTRLDSYFNQANTGQGTQFASTPIAIIADFRSNSIIVKGPKEVIAQAIQVLETIDVAEVDGKTNTVKVFPLRNTLAEEMAIVLQDAISGQQPNAGQGYNPNQQAQQNQQNNNQQIQPTQSSLGAAQLSLRTIDKKGKEVKSGIMFDVRVTADRNSNSLVVTGPAESMELIGALIDKLDRIPDAETQIKVFEIINGDAEGLLTMLENLFGSDTAQQGGQNGTSNLSQLPLQGLSATEGSTLINLRFSSDTRTNTIIASGPAGDLQVVEDLLNRLDTRDVTDRRPRVYRLSNAPALDVVEAINSYLGSRNDIVADDPRTVGAFIQADRSVVVVAETVSNSVIVSATPSQRAEIEELIRGLDRRPPMVKVKCLIAEVDLGQTEEFGVDIGIQDSLVFDRGTSIASDGSIGGIGFPFNTSPLPVANLIGAFPETMAGQAVSNLATGTVNSRLGYGGLVLSGGNESINILMRALKDKSSTRILSRPQITTVENNQGRASIGASVARIAGTTVTNGLSQQNIEFVDVGVILEVTPRVSPDGMIVMAVNATKSSVGPDSDGIVIGYSDGGVNSTPLPIISPNIEETIAQTTLMARSGQTVVFSGLITEEKQHVKRGAPILSDLPWIGPLFSFESDVAKRTELLIIMTPYLITDDQELTAQNNDEMDRMHWCLCDVAEVYGNTDYKGMEGTEPGVETIYPDADPSGMQGAPLYKVINGSEADAANRLAPTTNR